MLHPVRLAAALLIMALTLPALAADVVVRDRTMYYDIGGQTPAAIRAELDSKAPEALDGFDALTAFVFNWRYSYAKGRDVSGKPNCTISRTRVDIVIETTLPRHRNIAAAPTDVAARWAAYSAALQRHELQHAADFIAIGSNIPDALDGITGPDCAAAQAKANAEGTRYVDLAQKSADDFDRRTCHGATEGAKFP